MKKFLLAVIALLALSCTAAFAQATVHTFTFGTFNGDPVYGSPNGCASFQMIDGHPANQAIGYAGGVCVPYNFNPWWGLSAPNGPYLNPDGTPCAIGSTDVCEWGYPNNGFLTNNNNEPGLGAPTFIDPNCNMNTAGCIYYETGHSDFIGYGQGVHVDLTVFFKRVLWRDRYYRYHCCREQETNGSGTSSFTP